MIVEPALSPGALLAAVPADHYEPGEHLWGFGGLHGGLTLGLLTSAMQAGAPGAVLRSVTAQFHRPLRHRFTIETVPVRSGRTVQSLRSWAVSADTVRVEAAATFATVSPRRGFDVAPPTPPAPPADDCDVFTIPSELVPFARYTEIRPVGSNRPFSGAAEPVLTAWVRLADDVGAPDASRFVVLMDALAPSYSAVLTEPVLMPTVELSVWPSDALGATESPWILLQARTRSVSGGWVSEELDAWSPDGRFLGSGHQQRLVVDRS